MVARRAAVDVPVTELLVDGEERNAGIAWPLAVDRWLDAKLQEAKAAGMTTSRKELAVALMTAQDPDEEELVRLLRRHRRRTVGDLLNLADAAGVVTYLRQPPGPRARRPGQPS